MAPGRDRRGHREGDRSRRAAHRDRRGPGSGRRAGQCPAEGPHERVSGTRQDDAGGLPGTRAGREHRHRRGRPRADRHFERGTRVDHGGGQREHPRSLVGGARRGVHVRASSSAGAPGALSPVGVRVREATTDDAQAIAEINVRGWRTAYRGVVSDATLDAMSVEDLRARFRAFMADPERAATALVSLGDDGRVTGYTSFGPPREAPPDLEEVGEVYAIYVQPDAWGSGAGRALLRAAEEGLRDAGFRRAFLWVLEE